MQVVQVGLKREVGDFGHILRLGIDRRAIEPSAAVEYGYGGAFCPLCNEFGLPSGFSFVPSTKLARPTISPSLDRLPTIDHWEGDKEITGNYGTSRANLGNYFMFMEMQQKWIERQQEL